MKEPQSAIQENMSVADQARTAKKLTFVLFAAQSLGSAGFIAATTINSIVGADLGGNSAWAGVPTGVYLMGTAVAALLWGIAMDRIGRRGGLVYGLVLGIAGAAIAGIAVIIRSLPLLIGGLILMGAANAAVQLGRFAAAEVHPPDQRARAISNVVIGGTFGAVFGPLMVGPAGQLAKQIGINELAGPYTISLILFAIASIMVFVLLRPDPRDLGRQVARAFPQSASLEGSTRSIAEILRVPAAVAAMSSMVFGQMAMVMVMVITALHMRNHQHELTDISIVISSHTFGMYAFSLISGRLTDRWGRATVILFGAGTLIAACLAAILSPDVLPLAIALFLLGLGWNFCYVGGSTLLADQLSTAERARTQGFNDLLIGLVSAAGSLGSGFVFALVGYSVMSLVAATAAMIPIMFTVWWQIGQRRLAIAHE